MPFWGVLLSSFLLGLLASLFLKIYPVVILGGIAFCLIALLLVMSSKFSINGTSGGLGFLVLAGFLAIFLIGLSVGELFILPWGNIIDWINQSGYHISQFLKDNVLK